MCCHNVQLTEIPAKNIIFISQCVLVFQNDVEKHDSLIKELQLKLSYTWKDTKLEMFLCVFVLAIELQRTRTGETLTQWCLISYQQVVEFDLDAHGHSQGLI